MGGFFLCKNCHFDGAAVELSIGAKEKSYTPSKSLCMAYKISPHGAAHPLPVRRNDNAIFILLVTSCPSSSLASLILTSCILPPCLCFHRLYPLLYRHLPLHRQVLIDLPAASL